MYSFMEQYRKCLKFLSGTPFYLSLDYAVNMYIVNQIVADLYFSTLHPSCRK